MIPALTTPTRTPTLEQARAAFWETRTGNREAEDQALFDAHLRWSLEPGNRDRFLNSFFTYWTEGRSESPGTLQNAHDRERARRAGYAGNLTRLAQIGKALRRGMPRSEIDALSSEELERVLRVQKISDSESAAAALAPALERSRALLRDADPDAPTGTTEADALNLSALEMLPPAIYKAAVKAAQTGEVLELSNLADATRPPTFGTWAKQRGKCYLCGAIAEGGTVLDLHHMRVGEHEARRNDGGQEITIAAHRVCHIPVPNGPTTLHSREWTVGNDSAALTRLLEYLAAEHLRFEKWIRGET